MKDPENKEVEIETVSLNDASATSATQNDDTTNETECDARIAEMTAQIAELNDKYMRTAAELENTRRRASLDIEATARRRAMSIAEKFLPVMDAADAALKHMPDDAGIQSMARAIEAAFAQIGIVKIESVGEILNPQFHNAIQVIAAPENTKPNTIIEEMQPGYMFGDSVLRTAMVVVAK